MTTLSVPVNPGQVTSVRPLPWRRMAWVTWRQHRAALTGAVIFLGALACCLWVAGLQLHHAYAIGRACTPAGSFACYNVARTFDGTYTLLSDGAPLQLVPALVGVFLGAPVLARELETGTFRFAWTQGFGRWRWVLGKLVVLAIAVVVLSAAMTAVFAWYYRPYFAADNENHSLTQLLPLSPGMFDLHGVVFAAWTLAAFSIGALAGMLIRRVVPAIAIALAAYAGLAIATGGLLREHYLTPVLTRSLHLPSTAWIISQQWVNRAGRPVSQSVLGEVLQRGAPQLGGKGGVPQSASTWEYLARHGFTQWTTYQPASRFWPFQWIEGGWLLALSVVLIGGTVWLARRRAV